MAEENLQMFGGDWTERKLDAIEQYLRAYAKALSRQKFRRVYIDAFAGTGYREQRASPVASQPSIFEDELKELTAAEPQRFLDGSAKIALRVEPPFHHFVFIEHDEDKVRELEKLKAEFPAHASAIDVRPGDANSTIRDICRTWDKKGTRGVLFLDPFGMQAEWSTIESIAATGCIDTWILFPFAANRLMTKSATDIPAGWRDRLNKLFGTKEWEARFYKQRTLDDMFSSDITVVEKSLTLEGLGAYYGERLRTAFPVVAPNPALLRNDQNRPLFQLFFAAGAQPDKGGKIALNIASHILRKI
jgi:three-Cys-motif partner protein